MQNQFLEILAQSNADNAALIGYVRELDSREEKLFSCSVDSDQFRQEKNLFLRDTAMLYWNTVTEIVREKLKSEFIRESPPQFTTEERDFIDLGFFSERFCSKEIADSIARKFAPSVLPMMSMTEWITESFSDIFGHESVLLQRMKENHQSLGMRIKAMETKAKLMIPLVLCEGEESIPKDTSENMLQEFFSALPLYGVVAVRASEWRDGTEEERAKLGRGARIVTEVSEKLEMLLSAHELNNRDVVSRARTLLFDCRNLAVNQALIIKETLKIPARKERVSSKYTDDFLAAKIHLIDLASKKAEYASLMAKQVRRLYSPFLESKKGECSLNPISLSKAEYDIFSADNKILDVARVRTHGLPTMLIVPGTGTGAYDWSDNSLLIPVTSSGGELSSLASACASFRWDTDEERILKDSYNKLRENRKKNILDLAKTFSAEYLIWVIKESKGYRVLPGESRKWFSQVLAPRLHVL